jgi:hypothetical protein
MVSSDSIREYSKNRKNRFSSPKLSPVSRLENAVDYTPDSCSRFEDNLE